MVNRLVSVGDDFTLPASVNVADTNLPAHAKAAAIATKIGMGTQTVADPGPAGEVNLIFTGLNRSSAGGTNSVIRGEAQAASLVMHNNTGVDLPLTRAYEAIQFTVPAGQNTMGAVILRVKKSASLSGSATLTANIYTNNAGAPGSLLSLNNASTVIHASTLSSSAYTPVEFLLRNASAASTLYWVVLTTANLGGQSFILDSAATGTGNYSYSTNGTTWTAVPGSKPYMEVRGQTPAGIQGTSENYVAVRGDSVTYYGVYGNTVSGVGVHGGSEDGYGVEGISATGIAGVYGTGSNGYGVRGVGTNFAGVRGESSNGHGVQGVAATIAAGVRGENSSTGAGVFGQNSSTGPGVTAESLNGTGPALHVIGHVKATFGWPAGGSAQSGAGTGAPAPVVTGCNDVRGTVTFGTGTTPVAGNQVYVTFGKVYQSNPVVVICPANAATAALGQPYVSVVATTGFIVALPVAPAASQANTVYSFSYMVIE